MVHEEIATGWEWTTLPLGHRNAVAQPLLTWQGTEPYLRTIIAEMQLRPKLKVTDASGKVWTNADLPKELKTALDDGNLEYAMVKATDGGGRYAGAVLEFFKIWQRRPCP
ncbi:hypothetical protein [Streptomyces rimosus]|uniref:hypothetical protein n=1 Tax=Streptomyces rimosus TaxID=1927 RepID=UPI0004CA2E80|nr:hypothetical protein [Streptomyces rimosus]